MDTPAFFRRHLRASTPKLEQCLELEGNKFDPMADFSSSRFGKVDFVLVNLRTALALRGPR